MNETAKPVRMVMTSVGSEPVRRIDRFLEEHGHKFVGILTAPGPRIRRSEEYREVAKLARPGLDVIISNYPHRWADMIRPLKPDLILCVGFNWKIPADVLKIPPLGAYNMHDALLPKNRGRNSLGWALRTGDPVFGVTFHRMTPEFDDGPILAQRPIMISDEDNVDSVLPRFFQAFSEAHAEAFDRMLAGDPGIPQNESEVTYSPGAFEPEWREIDWNKPARDVHFQVRSWCGVRGVPRGAYGLIGETRALVLRTQLVNNLPAKASGVPGTVLSRENDNILIQCADAPLRIIEWETASDAVEV
jgi:methionyl-tRNA formyltransferase